MKGFLKEEVCKIIDIIGRFLINNLVRNRSVGLKRVKPMACPPRRAGIHVIMDLINPSSIKMHDPAGTNQRVHTSNRDGILRKFSRFRYHRIL